MWFIFAIYYMNMRWEHPDKQPCVLVLLIFMTPQQWNTSDTLTDQNEDMLTNSRRSLQALSLEVHLDNVKGNDAIPQRRLLFVSLRAATAHRPCLKIGMRAILWCWKGLSSPLHVARASLVARERHALRERTTRAGVVMGAETDNAFGILFAVTSNEDARRTLSLVKVVAVDGEEGAAHDAAGSGGHFRHLWMTNTNAISKKLPRRRWPRWSWQDFTCKGLNHGQLSCAENLKHVLVRWTPEEKQNWKIMIIGVTQDCNAAVRHIWTVPRGQKLWKNFYLPKSASRM